MTRTQRRRITRLGHRRKAALLRQFFAARKVVLVCDLHAEPRVAQ